MTSGGSTAWWDRHGCRLDARCADRPGTPPSSSRWRWRRRWGSGRSGVARGPPPRAAGSAPRRGRRWSPASPSTTARARRCWPPRSEEHTSELQSHHEIVCRLLLEKKKKKKNKKKHLKKKKK